MLSSSGYVPLSRRLKNLVNGRGSGPTLYCKHRAGGGNVTGLVEENRNELRNAIGFAMVTVLSQRRPAVLRAAGFVA